MRRVPSQCRLTSHVPKEDGAEQEDGVEEQQAQAETPIQPPAVQMNARHLREQRGEFCPPLLE